MAGGGAEPRFAANPLDPRRRPAYLRPPVSDALSSNGKTTDSDSVNCGSNPHGASNSSGTANPDRAIEAALRLYLTAE